jgi:hypothetical protein
MKLEPPSIGVGGTTVSSWRVRDQSAAAPSTVMLRTVRPTRSRLKLESPCVATASIVATPHR